MLFVIMLYVVHFIVVGESPVENSVDEKELFILLDGLTTAN